MRTVYVETSAVLAWLFREPAREAVSAAFAPPARLCSSTLTRVEAERAIARGAVAGSWTGAEAKQLVEVLDDFMREWVLWEAHPDIRRRAGHRFPVEPIRTLDALHLATALAIVPGYPDLSVATLDRRILANLEPLGLAPAF